MLWKDENGIYSTQYFPTYLGLMKDTRWISGSRTISEAKQRRAGSVTAGCAGGIIDNSSELEIEDLSSNPSQVGYIT